MAEARPTVEDGLYPTRVARPLAWSMRNMAAMSARFTRFVVSWFTVTVNVVDELLVIFITQDLKSFAECRGGATAFGYLPSIQVDLTPSVLQRVLYSSIVFENLDTLESDSGVSSEC